MADKKTIKPAFDTRVPPAEDRERAVCVHCGFIDYRNPKLVVGSVAEWESRILLCRRAIDPRKGFWTLPAGYLELGETIEEGAIREAREEASASIRIEQILAVYSVPRISQVQIIFRAALASDAIAPGVESLETGLFGWDDIPWSEIAFPTVHWALHHHRESRGRLDFPPYANPIESL